MDNIMIKETSQFLLSNIDDIKNKTISVANSGGIDSQVMLNIAYILKDELSFNLIIIHVNYNLRGEDSINDELFARDMAKKYNIDIYVKEIPPNSYIGKNIQLEARNDRYAFFEELYNKKIYDYLLMAHNKDDLVETIIYRMIKGAGTDVYKSLREKKGYILRPILNFYRKDIDKEVRVQLKIRGSNYKKYEDAAFRYYGDPKKNEWDNTQADEYLKIIIASPKAEDWTDGPEIIKIARFNIKKVKESGYGVYGYTYYRNPCKTSGIVLDGDRLWVNVVKGVKGNPGMLTIPMKINQYIPGAYEILYEK